MYVKPVSPSAARKQFSALFTVPPAQAVQPAPRAPRMFRATRPTAGRPAQNGGAR